MKKLLLIAAGAALALIAERVLAGMDEAFDRELTNGFGCCGPDQCCTVYHAPEFDTAIDDGELDQVVAGWRETLGWPDGGTPR